MVKEENVIVIDVDGTICHLPKDSRDYSKAIPHFSIIEKIRKFYSQGFYIILYTSRNMRTYKGNIGTINAKTAPILLKWLEKQKVPYNEIHFGKPWCGKNGFYIDDKTIRPTEFLDRSFEEISQLLKEEKKEWLKKNL